MRSVIFIACILGFGFATPLAAGAADSLRVEQAFEFERTLELASEEGNTLALADMIDDLEENPIDLNGASAAELQQIPGVSSLVAYNILAQRATRVFENVEDLAKVDGISPGLIRELSQFVTVRKRNSTIHTDATRVHYRARVVQSIAQRKGVAQIRFPTSPEDFYNKLVARIGTIGGSGELALDESEPAGPSLTVGLLTTKDPGEKNYADFICGHLLATVPSLSARLLVGDFLLEAGQGLVFWSPMGFSKGSEATANIGRNGIGLRPSLSSGSSWSFRGVAADVFLHNVSLCLFFSNKPMDASIDTAGVVTSIDLDGIHRTEADFQKRNRLRERAGGFRVNIGLADGLRIGASGFRAGFDRLVNLPGAYGFHGSGYSTVGLDASYSASNIGAFAEVAEDEKKSVAGVAGILLSPRPGLNLALLARSYPRDFRNFHGGGFGERGSGDGNESGIYCGCSYRLGDELTISSYYDQFWFPWRTSSLALPSGGNEMFFEAEFKPNERFGIEFRIRQREKPVHVAADNQTELSGQADLLRQQQNYRATLTIAATQSLVWRSRVEAVRVRYSARQTLEGGLLIFQDISCIPVHRFSLRLRAIAYQTESYDSRVYEFEEDSPGTFLNPALSGKGFRWYLIARFDYGRWIGVSLKYSQTRREGMRSSTGEIDNFSADQENRLAMQVDLKL